jgi:transposase
MAAPRKYPDELRERAIRSTLEARHDPASRASARKRIGEQLGINPETLRGWVIQAKIDEGHRPGVTSAEAARIVELERERTVSCADRMVRSATAFSAAELDRPQR